MRVGDKGNVEARIILNNTDHYYPASKQQISVIGFGDRISLLEPSAVKT